MGSIPRIVLARTLRHGGPWPDERIARVWEQFDQGTQRAILRLCRDATDARLTSLGNSVQSVSVPALVIWGQHDPWLAPELGEAYAHLLPDARLERVQSGGHWPWLEDPAVV